MFKATIVLLALIALSFAQNCYRGKFTTGEYVQLKWATDNTDIIFNATFPKGKDTWASFGIGKSSVEAMMNTNMFLSYEKDGKVNVLPYSFGDAERGGHPTFMHYQLSNIFYTSHPSGSVNFVFRRPLRSSSIRNFFNIFNEEHRLLFSIGSFKPNSTSEIGGHGFDYELTARKINLLGRFNNC